MSVEAMKRGLMSLDRPRRLALEIAEHVVDIHAWDNERRTLLHHLVATGADRLTRAHMDSVDVLLDAGASGSAAAEVLIKNEANLDAVDAQSRGPIHWAIDNRHAEMVEVLAGAGAELEGATFLRDGIAMTPLQGAVYNNASEIVTALTRAGADPETAPGRVLPPLHLACDRGPRVMAALLAAGANPEKATHFRDRMPVLHWAARLDADWALPLLLDAGADLNTLDALNKTALMEAACGDSVAAAKVLLARGADSDVRDCQGNTFWDWARDYMKAAHVAELGAFCNSLKTEAGLSHGETQPMVPGL